MRALENDAKMKHKGIYKKVFEMLSLIYTKNNFVGLVEDVLDGYIY